MQTDIIQTDTFHINWPKDIAGKAIVSGSFCISFSKKYDCLVYGFIYNAGVKREKKLNIVGVIKETFYPFVSMFQVRNRLGRLCLVKDSLIGGIHESQICIIDRLAVPKDAHTIFEHKLKQYLEKYGKEEDYTRLGL